MQPKLLKNSQLGEFVPAEYTGTNESGFAPIGDYVLVMPDTAAEVTSGGIALTAEVVERHTMAAETGVIIATGEGAFAWSADRTRPFGGRKPAPGDRVYIKRYSGQVMLGEDQRLYRVMEDNCIAAVKPRGGEGACELEAAE